MPRQPEASAQAHNDPRHQAVAAYDDSPANYRDRIFRAGLYKHFDAKRREIPPCQRRAGTIAGSWTALRSDSIHSSISPSPNRRLGVEETKGRGAKSICGSHRCRDAGLIYVPSAGHNDFRLIVPYLAHFQPGRPKSICYKGLEAPG